MKKKKKKKDVCSISFCLNREEEKHSRITRSLYQEKRGGIVKHIHSLCVFFWLCFPNCYVYSVIEDANG